MKIIHIISGNLGQGGAERLVMDLASAQAGLGHDVSICCFRDYKKESVDISPDVKLFSLHKSAGYTPFFSIKLRSFIKESNPDIVNFHLPAAFIYAILPIVSLPGIRFFYTVHSAADKEEQKKWVRKIRKFLILKNKIRFIAISDSIQKEFNEIYGVRNTELAFNGRKELSPGKSFDDVKDEIALLKNDENTNVFIAVGRLYDVKNFPLMIKAFGELSDENAILLIIGSGDKSQFDDIKPQNVHLLGAKYNVSDYLLCGDAFCCSSIWEGFPISIIEALSAGLPVLSTPVGGIPDVIKDGENGFLCKGLEVEDYKEILKKFLSLKDFEKKRMSEFNKSCFHSKYDIRKTAEKYLEIYQK